MHRPVADLDNSIFRFRKRLIAVLPELVGVHAVDRLIERAMQTDFRHRAGKVKDADRVKENENSCRHEEGTMPSGIAMPPNGRLPELQTCKEPFEHERRQKSSALALRRSFGAGTQVAVC